jgi:hypothetical protein
MILKFFTLALLAGSMAAQVHPPQRILMMGDSITKGYGFGNYTDPSPLRSVYGTAELLLHENVALPPEFLRLGGGWEGLKPDGTPIGPVSTLAGNVKFCIDKGEVHRGDWFVYEDAGQVNMFIHPAPLNMEKDVYKNYRAALSEMIRTADPIIGRDHFVVMTMFDYQPRCKICRWDEPLDDGVHTGNDIIRDTAAEMGVPIIDMNRIMDAANDVVTSKSYGRMVGPDGIHPNVYGNFVMALSILNSLGFDVKGWKLKEVTKHFRHPESGGDVPTVWGFNNDPSDEARAALVEELRKVVVKASAALRRRVN